MDKNTKIGLILICAILFGYTFFTSPSKEEIEAQKKHQDSLRIVEQNNSKVIDSIKNLNTNNVESKKVDASEFFGVTNNSESNYQTNSNSIVTLENNKVLITLDTKGGKIKSVFLKEYTNYQNKPLYIFDKDESNFNLDLYNRQSIGLSTDNQIFTPIKSPDGKSVTMRLKRDDNHYLDFEYKLLDNDYMVKYNVTLYGMNKELHPESLSNFKFYWNQKQKRQEKSKSFENRYADIIYRYQNQDIKKIDNTKGSFEEVTEPVSWISFKDQFFTFTIIPDKSFNNVQLSCTNIESEDYLKDYKSIALCPITINPTDNKISIGFRYYFGPVHYNTLKSYNTDNDKLNLQDQVDLGYKWLSWINKILVIPVFNLFLSFGWSMGIIILLLTLMVKTIIFPLTYKSFQSSAKMRVLRPQVKELEKKYPGQEKAMERQKAVMGLYSKAGASPLSGCLPMVLQMPVLISLFFFFPSAIELRHQSFLWADDLSSFDSIISWTGNIPIITTYLGNHISLFCVLMTITNIIFTKFNMSMTDSGQQQMAMMKWMSYFMPIFMMFFLNSYPSGLNYYYFISTLITIVMTIVFRKLTNEEKLLAKLEANKLKPKKKTGFMARLAEAQKIQAQQAQQKANAKNKKK